VHLQDSAAKAALVAQEKALDQEAEAQLGVLVAKDFAHKADPSKNPTVTPVDFLNMMTLLQRKPTAAVAFQGVLEQDTREEAARQTAAQELASLSQYAQLTDRHLRNLADPKNNPPLTTQEIVQMHDLMAKHPEKGLALQERLEALQRHRNETMTKGDPEIYSALYAQIAGGRMPDILPINAARSKGRLTAEQHRELIEEFNDARTPEGLTLTQKKKQMFDAVAPLIAPKNAMGALVDNSMGMRVYEFEHDAQQALARAKKEGKDPYALLDPTSPDYLGTPERIKPYTKTFMEQIDAALEQRGLGESTPAPTPGVAPEPAKPRKPLSEIFK